MKSQSKLIILITITLIFVFAILLISLQINEENAPDDSSATVPSYCSKLGVNFASYVPVSQSGSKGYDRAISHSMGSSLEIVNSESQLNATVANFKYASEHGIKPVLRPCVFGQQCDFVDPHKYVQFITNLSNQLPGKEFYVLTGANEPLLEPWYTSGVNRTYDPATNSFPDPYDESEMTKIATDLSNYVNIVKNGVASKSNVITLSPTFNLSDPDEPRLMDKLKSKVNWGEIDFFSVNTYNISDVRATEWLYGKTSFNIKGFDNYLNQYGYPARRYLILETAMLEVSAQGMDRATGLTRLKEEITKFKSDSKIQGYLLFNGFGTNPDSRWASLAMSDQELTYINGGSECFSGEVTPTPDSNCPSDINPQFWYGCQTGEEPPCGTITGWKDGSTMPATLQKNTVLHGNCFANGGLLDGVTKLYLDGNKVAESTTGELRDFVMNQSGTYKLECSKPSVASCSVSDQFSVTISGSGGTPTPTPSDTPNNCPTGVTIRFEQGDITNWQTAAELKLKLPVENLHINCFTNNGQALLDGGDIRVVGPDYTFNVEAPEARNITTMTGPGEYTAQCKFEGSVCAREKFTLGGAAQAGCGPLDNNTDSKIDLKDFSTFAKVYKKASCGAIGTTEPPACGFKDNNTDGKLDIKDFANFARKYNTQCTSQ